MEGLVSGLGQEMLQPDGKPDQGAETPVDDMDINDAYRVYLSTPTEQSMMVLFNAGGRLIRHYARCFGCGLPSDDLYQTGALGLLKAVNDYNPRYGASFSTWASCRIIGEIRHFADREKRHFPSAGMDEASARDGASAAVMDRVDDCADLSRAVGCLDKTQRHVLGALFYRGLSQEQTAKELGLTQRKISRIKSRAITLLGKMLSEPNFKLVKNVPSFRKMTWDKTAAKKG